MRHVSRTHRVSLDWSFDRINLDTKIQIRHFTRDEWNNLLCLFNISHFSSLCCAKKLGLLCCITERMAKRPTAMNLTSSVATSSSSVNSPIAPRCPGILKASSRQVGSSGRPNASKNQNSNPDAASSSQGWQKDDLLDVCSGKPVATEKDQEFLNYPETVCIGKLEAPLLQEIQKARKPMAELGHIFSMYHQTVYLTWRKSSRLWDKLVVEVRWMIWITSMWTQLYGYICVCYSSSCSSSCAR